jgi:hypothetical protein
MAEAATTSAWPGAAPLTKVNFRSPFGDVLQRNTSGAGGALKVIRSPSTSSVKQSFASGVWATVNVMTRPAPAPGAEELVIVIARPRVRRADARDSRACASICWPFHPALPGAEPETGRLRIGLSLWSG